MAPRVSQAHSARKLTKCPTAMPTERAEAELPDCVVETSVLASERKARMLGSERGTGFSTACDAMPTTFRTDA
jgi:hypothetical protein